jgi:hypothetical protein
MPSKLPSRLHSARLAWTDLAAAARTHPWLAAIGVVACTATSVATGDYLKPKDDLSADAIALGLSVTDAS